jgi:hypothetical protein
MTFFVYDSAGLFLEFAVQLARDKHKVFYYTPFYDSELFFKRYAMGFGIEGVEKLLYFWRTLRKFDPKDVTIVFPDVGNGDMAEFLRNKGYAVFAAGDGDILENHREILRKKMKELGLPTIPYVQITGLENLKNFLKKNPNKVVKLDIFRNDQESFVVENYKDAEVFLTNLEVKFGPLADEFPFIVEDIMEGEEPGFDLIFGGSDYLKPYLWGFEVSKGPYAGVLSDKMPAPLQNVAEKLKNLIAGYNWKGFISSEVIVKDGKGYLIDVCSRAPSPLGLGYTTLYENFSEMIWSVARGKQIQLKPRGKYMLVLPLERELQLDLPLWRKIRVPFYGLLKKGNFYFGISLSNFAKTKKEEYVGIPKYGGYVNLIAVGNDLEKMAKALLSIADYCSIDGYKFNYSEKDLTEAIEKLKKWESIS